MIGGSKSGDIIVTPDRKPRNKGPHKRPNKTPSRPPLAVSTTQIGGDGPPYFPMARAIIGGLAFSTVVSLLVVPALYAYFDTLAVWGRNVMRVARSGSLQSA